MSYESRIYIVKKTTLKDDPKDGGRFFGMKIAEFNMRIFSFLSDKLREQPVANCYVFADDGSTKILKDKYGKPLTEATPGFVIALLEKYISDGGDYRRAFPLLAFLKSLEDHKQQWEADEIVVLHYGY